jgi:carotenoid cleavage dioxygenase
MDDRFTSLPYRFGYAGHADPDRPFGASLDPRLRGRIASTWQRFDLSGGPARSFYVGDSQGLQECCFAPRSADAPEGDGYLIGVASNYAQMSSDLVIVDAQRLEGGAVATVKLPFRLRSGTHGAWMAASQIPMD